MSDRTFDLLNELGSGYEYVFFATYDFDPAFFEGYLLRHVDAIAEARRVCVLVDASQAVRAFAGTRSTTVNRQYVMHSVGRGRHSFHSKFVLAFGEHAVVAVVGSANLTRAGWTDNLELVESFTATPDVPNNAVVASTLAYLELVLQAAPSPTCSRLLREARSMAAWLDARIVEPSALLTTRAGTLLEQIRRRVSEPNNPVERIDLLSPYFDVDPSFFEALADAFSPPEIRIFTGGRDGVPSGLEEWSRRRAIALKCFRVGASSEGHRTLHAKAIAIVTKASQWLAFGSANATCAALVRAGGNDELLLLQQGKRTKSSLIDTLLAHVADVEPVEIASLAVVVRLPREEPLSFPIQLHEARADEGSLTLCVSGDVPFDASVALDGPDGPSTRSGLRGSGDQYSTGDIRTLAELLRRPLRARIIDRAATPISNEVFVLGLIERERDINATVKKALKRIEISPSAFALELDRIREMGDVDALIGFLWFASLPGGAFGRTYLPRTSVAPDALPRPRFDLSRQIELDQALDRFWRRHVGRLKKVVEKPSVEETPLALNLVTALHCVLELQASTLIEQLSSLRVVSTDGWRDARRLMDRVFARYRELVTTLAEWPVTVGRSRRKSELRSAIRLGKQELEQSMPVMVEWKHALDAAVSALSVVPENRDPVPAQYFRGDLALNWHDYSERIRNSLAPVLTLVA